MMERLLLVEIFAIIFGTSYGSFICPDMYQIAPCTCSMKTQELSCIGPNVTQKTLQNLMSTFKSVNPAGADIRALRVSKTNIQQFQTKIFAGKNTYGLFEISQNKNLQSLYDKLGREDKERIKARNVYFWECQLSWDDDGAMTDALNRFEGPSMMNLRNNNIVELKNSRSFYAPKTIRYESNVILDLSHNYITDIGYQWFIGIANAKQIDLSYNRIKNIWNEAFTQDNPSPEYIDENIRIDLSNNRLSETSKYYNTIFQKLKRPATLNLSSNLFQFLPQTTFMPFLNGDAKNQIYINNNVLVCDSFSKWLQDYKISYRDRVIGYSCSNAGGISIFNYKIESNC